MRSLLFAFLILAIPQLGHAVIFTEIAEPLFDVEPDFDGTEVVVIGSLDNYFDRAQVDVVVRMTGPTIKADMFANHALGPVWSNSKIGQIELPSLLIEANTTDLPAKTHPNLYEYLARNLKPRLDTAQVAALGDGLAKRQQLVKMDNSVLWRAGNLFKVKIPVPSTAPIGLYQVTSIAYFQGQELGRHDLTFRLGRGNTERSLYSLAMDHGWVYGSLGELLAILVGLGAAQIFGRK